MDALEPISREAEQLLKLSSLELEIAQAYTIDSERTYLSAADELGKIKGLFKKVDEYRKAETKPLDERKKRIMDFYRVPAEVLLDAERVLKRAMLNYQQELDNKRVALQHIADEHAKQEKTRQRTISQSAELAPALHIPMPIVHVPKPQADGIATVDTWSAEVTNTMELIRAVADGLVPQAAIQINQSFLNTQARALRDALIYPGVKVVCTKSIRAKATT